MSNNWQFCNYLQRLRVGLMRVGMLYLVSTILANLHVHLGRYTPTRSFYRIQPPIIEDYITPGDVWKDERIVMTEPDCSGVFDEDHMDDIEDLDADDGILAFDGQTEDYDSIDLGDKSDDDCE
ncbi:hypothetical protein BGZ54_005551 [Gamsiella multidivaricata]|nr:hypothetical protein BGZ54_005551 [Gamsiella multidivaricata]